MSTQPIKKQSFLHGAAILVVATFLVKIIGMVYKIPLQRIIGDAGYGYFNNAYDIYNVLLTISTAGLPVAMSRMIAEAQTLGNNAQIKQIYRVSIYLFLAIGIVGSSGMLIFAKQLAGWLNSPNSWVCMTALAPSVLFVCLVSSFRGYFQGQSNMTPTAVSQVLEAVFRCIIGLVGAYVLTKTGHSVAVAAAGAIVGVTMGTAVTAVYMGVKQRQTASALRLSGGGTAKPMGATMRQLLAIAVPITIGSAGLQIIGVFDTKIVLGRMLNALQLSQAAADELKGIYAYCQTIFNLPAAFIIPITVSIIPSITAHLTMKNQTGALKVEESGVRIMFLLALPCGVGLSVMAAPILQMLAGYSGEKLSVATAMLAILGVCVIFNCIVLLTNAIMQAHGDVRTPVIHLLIGGVVKVVVNYFLVGVPELGIVGAPIGTLCCYVSITVLNLLAMRRKMARTPRIGRILPKPLVATAAMGVAAFMAYDVLHIYLPSTTIACLGAVAIAAIVYCIFVAVLKIITLDDCQLLPKGDKIAKILRIR